MGTLASLAARALVVVYEDMLCCCERENVLCVYHDLKLLDAASILRKTGSDCAMWASECDCKCANVDAEGEMWSAEDGSVADEWWLVNFFRMS